VWYTSTRYCHTVVLRAVTLCSLVRGSQCHNATISLHTGQFPLGLLTCWLEQIPCHQILPDQINGIHANHEESTEDVGSMFFQNTDKHLYTTQCYNTQNQNSQPQKFHLIIFFSALALWVRPWLPCPFCSIQSSCSPSFYTHIPQIHLP